MRKLIDKIQLHKNVLLISLLTIIGLFFSIYHSLHIENAFTILSYPHKRPNATIIHKSSESVTLQGTFTAKENYLGSFIFRFNQSPHLEGQLVVFKMRERGKNGWYYIQKTRVGSVSFNPLFPIGFPVIPESKGRAYEYEITLYEELASMPNKDNLTITDIKTKYQYPKKILLSDRTAFFDFLSKKIRNVLLDTYFAPIILFYFSPAIYFFFLKFIKLSIFKFYTLFSIVVFIDIFYFPIITDIFYIITIILWIHYSIISNIDEKMSFYNSVFLIGIIPFAKFLTPTTVQAEKSAIWAYMYLLSGMIILLFRYAVKKKLIYSWC